MRKSFAFQLPGVYRNHKISNSEELLLVYFKIYIYINPRRDMMLLYLTN